MTTTATPTEPGDLLTHGAATYEVEERERWFAGFVPTGRIVSEQNHGLRVVLVHANYRIPTPS